MPDFEHQRHKPPTELQGPRPLALVCAPLRSNINVSRIVRIASCCGVGRILMCGNPKIDSKIARVEPHDVPLEIHRSLEPVLKKLRQEGYQLVGLEQTTNSESLHDFKFTPKTALVAGNEREGLKPEALQWLDHVVEIPVYGLPYSYNVATAVSMALYEYCRQNPNG